MLKRILLGFLLFSGFHLTNAQEPVKVLVKSGGYDREYLLYTPKNYGKGKPADLIVCLHGFNRTMEDFFKNYNIAQVADSLNLVVLAPQALPEQDPKVIAAAANLKDLGVDIPLDAAWGCGLRVKATASVFGIPITVLSEELNKPVDDAAFINEIIASTLADYTIRSENQFLFGTSMGGFMSYQYALRYGNSVSGLISICGSMGTDIKNMSAQVSVPICDFHSLTDEVVPYTGSYVQSGMTISLCYPKATVVQFWVDKNQASMNPQVEDVHYYPSDNGKTVKKYTYSHPENEVIHYQINGAEHSYYFKKENGDCMDYNEEINKFISSHTIHSGTGIRYPAPKVVQVYPNPAKDLIYFNIQQGKAMVFDLKGSPVLTRVFQSGQLDISSLSRGLYMIRIVSDGSIWTGKFTKSL